MPPHSPIDRIGPHAATLMHASVKSREKKLLTRRSTPLRTEESSKERKDDSPQQNANIGWTITFVYIAANPDIDVKAMALMCDLHVLLVGELLE